MELQHLIDSINQTNDYFQNEAVKQVNIALTLRNWVIGFYLFEYEQKGQDRAIYGEKLYKTIATRLKHVKGLSKRSLHLSVAFYRTYPQIFSTVSRKFEQQQWATRIVQTLSAQLPVSKPLVQPNDPDLLLSIQ